jgi:hypothetical protein
MSSRRFRFRAALSLAAVLVSTAFVAPVTAQWFNQRTPGIPRNADGKPNLSAPAPRAPDGKSDLTGLWTIPGPTTDFEPGEVPAWVEALVRARTGDFYKDRPGYHCLPWGPEYSSTGGRRRILQTPSVIAILNEDLTYRQIFLDGRTLEPDPNPNWMGYSVGHWEDDTLVVDSLGFNDRTWLNGRGYPHSDKLRMTERFRRRDFGHLDVDVKLEDKALYSRPWTFHVTGQFAADTEMGDERCEESVSGREHWVGKTSDFEKSAVKVRPEVLAKYVGTYKGVWQRAPRTVEVTYSSGDLFVAINGGQRKPVIPQSDTSFSGPLQYTFVRDGNGVATDVIESHTGSDYKYPRVK